MQNALTEAKPLFQPKASALAVMAGRFNVESDKLLGTLKNTVFKGATNDELLALVVVANEYGLNPLTKEIYAFPAKGGGIVPVVSVDGWNNLANSHPQMDGMEFEFHHEGDKLISCTCVIYRKDRSKPIRVTEYLAECRRNSEPWKMEHRMLRHKALIQCVRVAFGFSGVYDEEDAKTVAATVIDVPAANIPAANNFPAPSGLSDRGGFDKCIDATPASVKESGQPHQPRAKNSETLTLESEPVSLLDQLTSRMRAAGLTWPQVERVALSGGLLVEPVTALEKASDEDIRALLHGWVNIEPLAREVVL